MNVQRLNPWNWFKHEQPHGEPGSVPVMQHRSEQNPVVGSRTMHPMFRIHDEIDRLFDEAFSGFGWPSITGHSLSDWSWLNTSNPKIDVAGDDKSYQVQLDVPGLDEKDLSIEVQGDSLVIKGGKQDSDERQDKHYYRVERRYGEFQRTLALPADVDVEAIKATLSNGVLSLDIPRKPLPEKDVKKISIH